VLFAQYPILRVSLEPNECFGLLKRIRGFNNENNKSKYRSSLTDKYLDYCIECDYCQMQSHYNKLAEDMQCEASH